MRSIRTHTPSKKIEKPTKSRAPPNLIQTYNRTPARRKQKRNFFLFCVQRNKQFTTTTTTKRATIRRLADSDVVHHFRPRGNYVELFVLFEEKQ